MSTSTPGIPHRIRLAAVTAIMFFTWLVVGMIYFDRFFPPFKGLQLWLMPWKGLYTIPPGHSLDKRLAAMQELLDASNRVADYSFILMIVSFASLSIYLSFVYQQKQRRAHENMILSLKNLEIARRNEFIRYISATISHEFKNNLGRIKRRIDLLPGLPPDAQERIDDNLDKLFADIDIFKKISDEREAGLTEFKSLDVKAMLNDLVVQYGDLADVVIHETVRVPMIFAAPPLLKTVFENVIDNAVKYKKPDQPRAHVRIFSTMDNDVGRRYVTISFRDDGVGMDEQKAERCFYKGKGVGENWGQGLYFAKYVVGLHAGKIRIDKEHTAPGIGSGIIINLPCVEEALNV